MLRKILLTLLILVCAIPARATDSLNNPATTGPTTDEVIEQFRIDLQASAPEIMARGLVLSSVEAAKFWPMFEAFQREQRAIIEEQLTAVLQYRDTFHKLTDEDALDYANSLLERDQRTHDLRVKYLAMFQEVVSPRIAARAIQLDRRLGLVGQVKISSQVPLIP